MSHSTILGENDELEVEGPSNALDIEERVENEWEKEVEQPDDEEEDHDFFDNVNSIQDQDVDIRERSIDGMEDDEEIEEHNAREHDGENKNDVEAIHATPYDPLTQSDNDDGHDSTLEVIGEDDDQQDSDEEEYPQITKSENSLIKVKLEDQSAPSRRKRKRRVTQKDRILAEYTSELESAEQEREITTKEVEGAKKLLVFAQSRFDRASSRNTEAEKLVVSASQKIESLLRNTNSHHNRLSNKKHKMLKPTWNGMYIRLQKFKNENGHCFVPLSAKRQPQLKDLVDWVARQRADNARNEGDRRKLPRDKREALEHLGLVWNDPLWHQRYRELVQYKAGNGNVHVPGSSRTHTVLGRWVFKQRKDYKALMAGKKSPMTQERIQMLESLGFEWIRDDYDCKFDVQYQELLKYKEEHGDCLVPQVYAPNQKMARWVRKQQEYFRDLEDGKPSPLTTARLHMLEDIGFAFERGSRKGRRRWNDRYAELVRYKETYGDCLISEDDETYAGLGRWVFKLKTEYRLYIEDKTTMLTTERIRLLGELGIDLKKEAQAQQTESSAVQLNINKHISQNMPPCLPQIVLPTLPQNISQSIPPSIPQSIPQSIPPNISQNMHQNVHQNVHQIVPQSLHENIPQSVNQNIPQNTLQNVNQNGHPMVHQNVLPNVHPNIHSNVLPHVHQNVHQNIHQNVHEQHHQQLNEHNPTSNVAVDSGNYFQHNPTHQETYQNNTYTYRY